MISASVRRLNVFRTVVEAGGVARAATVLGISQPAVTGHLKALSTHVEQDIFVRRAGLTSTLTEAGERLYEHAVNVVSAANQTSVALTEIRERGVARLTIAMSRSLTGPAFSDHVAKFMRRNPDVRLSIHCESDEDVLRLVRSGLVDCGLFASLGSVPDLESTVIGSDELVFAIAATHPLARARRPTRRQFGDYCFIGPDPGSNDAIVDHAFRSISVRRPAVAIEVREPDTVNDLVLHGAGTSVSSFRRIRDELASGQLAALDFNRPPVRVEIRWAAPPAQPLSRVGAELIAFIERSRVFHYPSLANAHVKRIKIY